MVSDRVSNKECLSTQSSNDGALVGERCEKRKDAKKRERWRERVRRIEREKEEDKSD